MASVSLYRVMEASGIFWALVWLGIGVCAVDLVLLMETRWGRSNLLRKCLILSILLHLVAAGYCNTLNFAEAVFQPPPIRISVADEPAGEQPGQRAGGLGGAHAVAAPEKPWESFPGGPVWQPQRADPERPSPAPILQPQRTPGPSAESPSGLPLEHVPPVPVVRAEPESPPAAKPLTPIAPERHAEPIAAPAAQWHEAPRVALPAPAAPTRPEIAIVSPGAIAQSTINLPRSSVVLPPPLPRMSTEEPSTSPPPAPRLAPQHSRPYAPSPANLAGGPITSVGTAGPETAGTSAAASQSGSSTGSNSSGRLWSPGAAASGRGSAAPALGDPLASIAGPGLGPSTGTGSGPATGTGSGSSAGTGTGSGPTAGAGILPSLPPRRDGISGPTPEVYKLRTAPNRDQLAERYGATPETLAAVRAALRWLASVQNPDGRWSGAGQGAGREMKVLGEDRGHAGAHADTAMTGLALLAFLANGETHRTDNPNREAVRRGLEFLLRSQKQSGSLAGDGNIIEAMYCHGIATFAMSEALGMTNDPLLQEPVRRAIGFTVSSQHPTAGGWRYSPDDPGDTSQMGWQLMALRSAELAGIPLPDANRQGVIKFLRSVAQGHDWGLAGYRPGDEPTRTMTAEALVCWLLLGMRPQDPAAAEASNYLLAQLPDRQHVNIYYWYYATLGLHHLQGPAWTRWNDALRPALLATQRKDGVMAGTWDPDPIWGTYGGRIFSTAMATMCLEVYFRYLPLYKPH